MIIKLGRITALLASILWLAAACTPSPRYRPEPDSSTRSPRTQPPAKASEVYDPEALSKPLEVIYIEEVLEGTASYYGADFHKNLTSSGEIFDMYGLSAACVVLPLNSIVRVTNLRNGKSAVIRINDRGPYVDNRILDCSYGLAKKLDFITDGLTEVRIEVIFRGDDQAVQRR